MIDSNRELFYLFFYIIERSDMIVPAGGRQTQEFLLMGVECLMYCTHTTSGRFFFFPDNEHLRRQKFENNSAHVNSLPLGYCLIMLPLRCRFCM